MKVSAPFAAVKSPAPAVSPGSADARQSTVTRLPLAGASRTVNATAPPSVAVASSTLRPGSRSSSSIVPVTVRLPARSTLPSGVMRTSKVSSSSSAVSSAVATVIVFVVSPGAKVRTPSCGKGSKSAAAADTPSTRTSQPRFTVLPLASVSVTSNCTGSPSTADAAMTSSTPGGSSLSVSVSVASATLPAVRPV